MWNLFTIGSLQFCNDSQIASLEANQNPSRPLFHLLKKLYIKQQQVVSTLVLIYFKRIWLGHTIKGNFLTFQTGDAPYFVYDFSRKLFMFYSIILFYYFVYDFSRKLFMFYSIN